MIFTSFIYFISDLLTFRYFLTESKKHVYDKISYPFTTSVSQNGRMLIFKYFEGKKIMMLLNTTLILTPVVYKFLI